MSDYLCLRFNDTTLHPGAVVSWVVLSSTAQVVVAGECLLEQLVGELAEQLPESEHIGRTVVIMPAYAALMTEAELPSRQQRHMKQVLPYLVEEQLIDPIESMHLATPVLHEQNRVPVMAVARHQLAGWLDQLAEIEIAPDYLFLDACCLPDKIGDSQILIDDTRLLLRGNRYHGLCLDYDTMDSTLKLVLGSLQAGDAQNSQDLEVDSLDVPVQESGEALINLIVADESDLQKLQALARQSGESESTESDVEAQPAGSTDELETFDVEAELMAEAGQRTSLADRVDRVDRLIRSENICTERTHYSETVAQLLAVSAVQSLDLNLNLLQGDFRPANANAQNQRIVRRVTAAVAACLGLFLLVTLAGGAYLNWRADSYFDQSVAIYRELFPKQRKVIDPVKQMKRQLSGQAVGGTTSEFLPLLDAASRSLSALEQDSDADASIKQLRYDVQRGNIAIDIHASDIDELEAYKDRLTAEGLSVDILSANQDGQVVKGRIQIGRS